MNEYEADNRAGKWRRWVVFAFIAVVISGIGIIARRYQEFQPPKPTKSALSGKSVLPDLKLAEQDGDKDGLRDWEEELYHTNPANSDTDNDGTTDLEEVKGQRDPLKAGNDHIVIDRKPAQVLEEARGKNYTKELSSLFVAQYFQQKESGNFNADTLTQQILGTYFNQNTGLDLPITKIDELKQEADNSEPSIKRYLNTIATVAKDHLTGAEQPMLLLTNITQLDDLPTELIKFDPIIARYATAYDAVKKVAVPSSWIGYHKRIADILLTQLTLLEKVRASEDDFVQIYLSMIRSQQLFDELRQLRIDMRNSLAVSKIRFSATDPFTQIFGEL